MHIFPSMAEVKAAAQKAQGRYAVMPVMVPLLSDICTPIEALRRLKEHSAHCFLFESVVTSEDFGRYSFLGFNPSLDLYCREGQLTCEGELAAQVAAEEKSDPNAVVRQVLAQFKSPSRSELESLLCDAGELTRTVLPLLPPFTGGLVGYFAYDYLGYSEARVRQAAAAVADFDPHQFKDFDLMLFTEVIAFDHLHQQLILIANVPLCADPAALELGYQGAERKLEQLCTILNTPAHSAPTPGQLLGPLTPRFSAEQYCAMVERAQHYIHEGDIFQVVLSNCLSAPFAGSLLDTYRLLRTLNPSPYMFYLGGTDIEVAGASPETLVSLKNGVLHTYPLAGTRPRGRTKDEDRRLEQELLADDKERSEHNMLVDLGRNDLGKVAALGTVKLERYLEVLRFSHVMHLGSTVTAELDASCDALAALQAILPAGTLSGAPKIRAAEIITELEGKKRGLYGGAVGYIDLAGNMDMGIAIRLCFKQDGQVFIQSGAGIVADSVPHKEYQECLNKAKAVVTALTEACALDPNSSLLKQSQAAAQSQAAQQSQADAQSQAAQQSQAAAPSQA